MKGILPLLVCMQRVRMSNTHPEMVDRNCRDCGAVVGIYPSGQRVIKERADTQIVCDACYFAYYSDMPTVNAPGAIAEGMESRIAGGQLFPFGRILITPGASAACVTLEHELSAILLRHGRGDWGEMDLHDKRTNNDALKCGHRLLSAYTLSGGVKIWVITEPDRSATTVLLPEEY